MWLLLIAPVLIAAVLYRANQYPKGYYGNPLDIRVELAANFGEVRTDHYHMGLDIRTNGKENLPVYAAADGFISRVTIEEGSFGKAVYVTHPNGTMSVYGHLSQFMPALENLMHEQQYKEERWQQDILFTNKSFPVNKGMLIAYSGNTGASEGPHLHFEIRDVRTGNNLNPLMNGFKLNDRIAPVIHGLYWYNAAKSIYQAEAIPINIKNDGNQYNTKDGTILVNTPRINFGIEATDKNAETKYRLGIYKARLYMDDSLVFCFALDSLCYSNTRYVNACIDYGKWFQQGNSIQLLRKLPGNKLPVFGGSKGNGILQLEDKKVHAIKIVICDATGNTATITCKIKYDGMHDKENNSTNYTKLLLPNKHNVVRTVNAEVSFSNNAFYDTVPFDMHEETTTETNAASNLIYLHNASVPVHGSYAVRIKATLPANSPLKKYTVMQLINDKHSFVVKGDWDANVMEATFTELGTAQLVIDTIAPDVQCNEGDNCHFSQNDKALHILYKDNIVGTASFRGEIDGHWVLFEKKGDLFTYRFDEHCAPGRHKLLVTVADVAGNVTSKTFVFEKE